MYANDQARAVSGGAFFSGPMRPCMHSRGPSFARVFSRATACPSQVSPRIAAITKSAFHSDGSPGTSRERRALKYRVRDIPKCPGPGAMNRRLGRDR